MDDVDRLFRCFKCGITPPKSAVRERKANKPKSKQASSPPDDSTSSSIFSPESAGGERPQNTNSFQLASKKSTSTAVQADGFNCGKAISPVVFYGSPQGVPPKKPSSLLRLLREIHIDLANQNKLNLRKELWATFPRQDEAMKFAKDYDHARVFSYQDHFNGQRRFLVSSYKEFWRRYKIINSKHRHHYEVIQENLPCHLYFDLEFARKINADKNGDEMVDLLVSAVFEALCDKYSISGSNEWIVELDSSTEEKFSRHLIIRIPKMAFKDNSHAGAFVSEICARILSRRDKGGDYYKLFVLKDSSSVEPCQLFVDTAVYSRNRCFRLALSSKAGKSSVLLPTGRFKCKNMCEEEMFMDTLICNMDVDCKKLLVCKMDASCVKTLHFDTELNHTFGKHSTVPQAFKLNACTSDIPATYYIGKSPFPLLDMFIESIASIGNVSGKIRCWYWFSESGLMIYSMSRNRFCEHIGREHKSNHVMYVVDLRRADYYQKCHDPDCRGFRSILRPVPEDVIPDTAISVDSEQIARCEGSTNYSLSQQYDENDKEHALLYNDKNKPDSCERDVQWLEAVKVADDVENMQSSMWLDNMEEADEEDESWWMAVEKTASEVEQSHYQLI